MLKKQLKSRIFLSFSWLVYGIFIDNCGLKNARCFVIYTSRSSCSNIRRVLMFSTHLHIISFFSRIFSTFKGDLLLDFYFVRSILPTPYLLLGIIGFFLDFRTKHFIRSACIQRYSCGERLLRQRWESHNLTWSWNLARRRRWLNRLLVMDSCSSWNILMRCPRA